MTTFSEDEMKMIMLTYEETKNLGEVRRCFAKKFHPRHPRKVPGLKAFRRVIDRFKSTASCKKQCPPGRPKMIEETVAAVECFFKQNEGSSIREASSELGLSYGTVYRILKQKLSWKPYKIRRVQCLTDAQVESRLTACKFWLEFQEEWFERIIWTDEKMFVLVSEPHRQNDRVWALVSPNKVAACKKTTGTKCMAWTGMVNGKCLPVVWFEGSVNGQVYLELLQNTLWPAVRASATRKQFWYQHDGAPCHVATQCLEFLKSKFGDRILSRNTKHHWPANSPDLTPMDFSFWTQASNHVKKVKPQSLDAMKRAVEDFAANLDEEAIRKMCRHTRKRALACVSAEGKYFEHRM